ncbi:uracil-DNA glycosylase family protein [Rickettsia endosymbiont of Culicoides newsteadi]|uniref:uracil-DNA glycosylase family protein n=1 Tax=Rickettsia endosymbiont of Culicoides newsteadi TaxID=1961830 RepID=UPI000B9B97D3|nr:uracil-DNA glycosylase family protein [Rickettsia endosymbiont of Culicoides newsteadi]OZG32371.1 uracil-DNA glycosylase [Rickettsia endosymbiont of Culicoides newsteadi]
MTHLTKKINQLKWLQAIGIDYYLSKSAITGHSTLPLSFPHRRESIIDPCLRRDETLSIPGHSTLPLSFPRRRESSIDTCLRRDDTEKVNCHSRVGGNLAPAPKQDNIISLSRSLANSASSLEELKQLLMDFNGCNLKKLANKTVFADGNPQSSIMFIGEAPGSSEDAEGIPFCGESGKLLDNVLASINISRKHNAYITNTVFWRPPANRQPTQEEIDICRPFVEKHIALINPKLIILVGNVAATSLLGKNAGISKIRQEYYLYTNQYLIKPIKTTAIFHPAYLLRQPMQKKTIWYDLIKIQEYINANITIIH